MNKIIGNKKLYLAMGIVFAVAMMFLVGPAMSAVSQPPVSSTTAMGSAYTPGVMALIDNFEYWETPLNQGWNATEPGLPGGYPVWGMNIGSGLISTVLDFQEGSRVAEVFYPSNVMVPNMQKYMVTRQIPPLPADDPVLPVLSLKMRAPVSIESFDSFEVIAICTVASDPVSQVQVRLIPRADTGVNTNSPVAIPENTATLNAGVVEVKIGREAEDGSWHLIRVNLAGAIAVAGGPALISVDGIALVGNQFRCDDIKLLSLAANASTAKDLYMFHINQVFTQIFDPVGYTRFIFASDPIADKILPAGGNAGNTQALATAASMSLAEMNFEFWKATVMEGTAADQAITLVDYNAAIAAYEASIAPQTMKDVRRAAIKAGGGIITIGLGVGGADIEIDARLVYPLDVAMLTDGVMAQGPVASDGVNMLSFAGSVGGAHELGTGANLVSPVPTDTPMQYYPLYKIASNATGNSYLTSAEIKNVGMSLYYGGYDVWPTAAMIAIPPQQTIENMVVTVVVSDGLSEDVESFMIETVNYPVTNTPPVIEDLDDVIFDVEAGTQTVQLTATDADSLTYNSAVQFNDDMGQIIWEAFLQGLPAYAYGPYVESLINQKTGLVSFDPISEGAYEMIVTARDPLGAEAYGAFTIYCVNSATWLNHPPVMLRDWEHPMIGSQGREMVLSLDQIVDPDGEPLFYSCNIGAIGYVNGTPTWTFQTEYPGTYMIEIVAYDMSGGYIVIPQEIIITTWWSM